MAFPQPTVMTANGTIVRCRAVKMDPTTNHSVIQCNVVNDIPIGIAGDEARTAPTADVGISPYQVAQAGEPVNVHPNGCECTLEIGTGGCSAGNRLTTDANGAGVINPKTGAPPHIFATALTAANAGELARVVVSIFDTVRGAVT